MTTTQQKVWLIVGCSGGFGREIALLALERGDKVIATSRDASKLSDLKSRGAETIDLDVTHPEAKVKQAIADAVGRVGGRLDVLINNAGYVLVGGVDECSDEEIHDQFETNVFGLIKVIAGVLPILRKQKSGTIVNIGSVGGWKGAAIGGIYCATKFAVVGITESVRLENESFGIETTVVEPGYFRTDLLAEGHSVFAKREDEDLKPLSQKMRTMFKGVHQNQPGDPKKGAAVIVDAITKMGPFEGKALPLRLLVGSDAWQYVEDSIKDSSENLEQWSKHTSNTNFDDV